MLIILLLILTSVIVAILFLGAFFWAVKSGQYDDTYSPSVRMRFDDRKEVAPAKEKKDQEASNSIS